MAWFDKDDSQPQPTAVTHARVLKVIKENFGFSGNDEDEGKFYCYVNGVPVRFDSEPLPFAVYVNASLFEATLPDSRYAEMREWCNDVNYETHFVQCVARRTEDNDVTLTIDSAFVTEQGQTDAQLESSLDLALTAVLQTAKKYYEDFKLELPDGLED